MLTDADHWGGPRERSGEQEGIPDLQELREEWAGDQGITVRLFAQTSVHRAQWGPIPSENEGGVRETSRE